MYGEKAEGLVRGRPTNWRRRVRADCSGRVFSTRGCYSRLAAASVTAPKPSLHTSTFEERKRGSGSKHKAVYENPGKNTRMWSQLRVAPQRPSKRCFSLSLNYIQDWLLVAYFLSADCPTLLSQTPHLFRSRSKLQCIVIGDM